MGPRERDMSRAKKSPLESLLSAPRVREAARALIEAVAAEAEERTLTPRQYDGALKEIARTTRGTDAGRFADRAAHDPRCALSLTFSECSAFEIVGDKSIWQSLTRARVRLDLHKGDDFGAVVVYDNELLFGTLDTLGAELGGTFRTDSLADLEWDVRIAGMPTDHRLWRMRLYRAYLEGEIGKLEGRVGRQRHVGFEFRLGPGSVAGAEQRECKLFVSLAVFRIELDRLPERLDGPTSILVGAVRLVHQQRAQVEEDLRGALRVEFPDFAARARRIWGEAWQGRSSDGLVDEGRGER